MRPIHPFNVTKNIEFYFLYGIQLAFTTSLPDLREIKSPDLRNSRKKKWGGDSGNLPNYQLCSLREVSERHLGPWGMRFCHCEGNKNPRLRWMLCRAGQSFDVESGKSQLPYLLCHKPPCDLSMSYPSCPSPSRGLDEKRSLSKNFLVMGAVVSPSPGLPPFLDEDRPPGLDFPWHTFPNVLHPKASPSSGSYGQGRWHGSLVLCISSAPAGNSWALWGGGEREM